MRYTQESFAGRIARREVDRQLRPPHRRRDRRRRREPSSASPRPIPSALLVEDRAPVHVARGETTDLYAGWVHQLPLLQPVHVNERTYDGARDGRRRVLEPARSPTAPQIVVPEERVMNAERAILVQQLVQSWRYSVGNPYEELSFAEALDTAQVMAEYGYPTTADGILRIALDRLPQRFSSWRAGELLLAAAVNYDLYRDRKALTRETPDLATAVETLAGRQLTEGDASRPASARAALVRPSRRRRRRAGAGRRLAGSRGDRPGLVGDRPRRRSRRAPARSRSGSSARSARPRARSRCGCRTARSSSRRRSPTRRARTRGSRQRATGRTGTSSCRTRSPPGSSRRAARRRRASCATCRSTARGSLGVTRADAHIAYGRNIVGDGLGEVYVHESVALPRRQRPARPARPDASTGCSPRA